MDVKEAMAALQKLGTAQTRKTWSAHGATGDFFGVKIGDMKPLAKKLKGAQDVALDLYATGNLDAMYLAGLVADGARMTRQDLNGWAKAARWSMIAEYTVPWVAAESPHAAELARKWIASKQERVACVGWNLWSGIVSLTPDAELDLEELEALLARVEREIGRAANRVRYCMNGFVIAVGAGVKPLHARAKAAAQRIGKVEVEMNGTACKVPDAQEMLAKIAGMGRVGMKRKTMKC
jgi:3-methyladenine DNA glycosylase AlkD